MILRGHALPFSTRLAMRLACANDNLVPGWHWALAILLMWLASAFIPAILP